MRRLRFIRVAVLLLIGLSAASVSVGVAQQESLAQTKDRAEYLIKQLKYTEALPLLEKIAIYEPNDPRTQFHLGFALIAKANITKDQAEQKALRVRARHAFIKSKELDIKEPVVDALILSIPEDGGAAPVFSQNVEANALMVQAEGFFSQGQMENALRNYRRALELDPQIYEAALFSGDVYMHREDYENAEVWYQKAIAINPNRETAYRYSATPLMKQGKLEQARDRYVEAYITEPYSHFATGGLTQWGQATGATLGHPKIDIPSTVTFDEKGNAKINLDNSVLLGGKDDGSFAWISYGVARTSWHNERFAKTFPNEYTYRHSLPEEADALRSVVTIASSEKKVKSLSPALAQLKKLNDEGLLEAYILLAHADRGIATDYPVYLKGNRDKLRRYVIEYVVTGGGKQ